MSSDDHGPRWQRPGVSTRPHGRSPVGVFVAASAVLVASTTILVSLTSSNPALADVSQVAAGSITPVVPGLPAEASSILTNLTMVDGSAPGYITADKCSLLSAAPQSKSNGNHAVVAAIANLSVVPLDPDGRFCIYNQQPVDLVADVQGFRAAVRRWPGLHVDNTDSAHRHEECTHASLGIVRHPSPDQLRARNDSRSRQPNDGRRAHGYITADKCSTLVPGPQSNSNGNHGAAVVIANLSVVPVDSDGSFCIYNQQAVNLVVDLQGSFSSTAPSGLNFTPVAPNRKLDTRVAPLVRPTAGSITRVDTGVAANTAAVLVNLTMVDGVAAGFITADKCSALSPGPQSRSNGNHDVSTAIANLSVVPVDPDGSFCIYNQQAVNLVVDLQGSFSASGALQFFPIGPNRVLDTR